MFAPVARQADREGRALAEAISSERRRRDVSQGELAVLFGTTQQTVGKWINGVTRPGDRHIAALADWLGMTEAKVRELRGPMNPGTRQDLRIRIENVESRLDQLVDRLERIALALDRIAPPND